MALTVEEKLERAAKAEEQLRDATREAHEARAALRDVVKATRGTIEETIAAEVVRQVGAVADEVREQMRAEASAVVDDLSARWRERLDLLD